MGRLRLMDPESMSFCFIFYNSLGTFLDEIPCLFSKRKYLVQPRVGQKHPVCQLQHPPAAQATHNTVAYMESLQLEKNFRMKLGLQTECNKYLSHYQHLLWARLALTATDGEMHSPSHAVHRAQQLLSCTAGDEQVCLFPTPLPNGAHLKWSTFTSKIHRPQQIPICINLCFC